MVSSDISASQFDNMSASSSGTGVSNGSLADGITVSTYMGGSQDPLDTNSSNVANSGHLYNNQGYDNPAFSSSVSSGLDKASVSNGPDPGGVRGVAEPNPEDNLPCGWGCLRPACCQRLRNIKLFLFFMCLAGAIQGMVVNGFVSVVISSIEKRFELASTQSGIIASGYDIASVICLIPVSYFGGIGCKPRWLGIGIFLMGIGSFIFALPHFITDLYIYENVNDLNSCTAGMSNSTASSLEQCSSSQQSSLSQYRYVLILGQVLHGVGATPLYTLGVTYLDENLKAKMTSVYVGIFYAMAIVGPALGYLLGGMFLDFFCDFDNVDSSGLSITPDSPVWVGAWWIGFLLSGGLAFLTAIPILGFPKYMPDSSYLRTERVSEAYVVDSSGIQQEQKDSKHGVKEIWPSVKMLLTNPTFMFLNLAGASEGLLLSGFAAFTPKFIEAQFGITSSWAAMLVGFATIPAGGGGTVLGGYLVKRFNLRCAGIIRMCVVTTFITLVLLLVFMVQCPLLAFAGVNVEYQNSTTEILEFNLTSPCNEACDCDSHSSYQPICGQDDIMYFSPCHAGCGISVINGTKTYRDCSCVEGFNASYGTASEGKCESMCTMLSLFLGIFSVIILFTFMTSMPALTATLRCVPDKQKSFALGIQWILVRCLGTIPAPILFGAVIDRTCQLWQTSAAGNSHTDITDSCQQTETEGMGSCYFYNNSNMSLYIMGISVVGKVLSLLFFILSLALYKAPPSADDIGNMDSSSNGAAGEHSKGRSSKDSNLNVISNKPVSHGQEIDVGAQGVYKPVDDAYNYI